jgi:transmembrane sensor
VKEDGGKDSIGIDRWSRALSWYDALRAADQKELTYSVGRDWQDWYADAENRRVFDNISRLLADRNDYRQRRRRGKAELGEDAYDLSVPITEWRRFQSPRVSCKQRSIGALWWWVSGGIGIAAIAAALTLWPRSLGIGGDAGPAVYQTEIGGLRHVHLTDGSSIILGGRTELSVAFSSRSRSVRVMEGQAWFKVAHDRRWPFIVTAGDESIVDVGTAFLVTRESDRVVVTVTQGTVEVSAQQPGSASLTMDHGLIPRPVAHIRIAHGEQLAFSDAGVVGPIKLTDTHAATTWTHGRLTFDNQPLRYVVETVNRYSSRRIVVDRSASTLRFSGIIVDTQIEDWLQSLEAIFPVSVREQGGSIRIQMRHSILAKK